MAVTSSADRDVDIAIVGGGISGLYCALQLARRIKQKLPLLIGGASVGFEGALRSTDNLLDYFDGTNRPQRI